MVLSARFVVVCILFCIFLRVILKGVLRRVLVVRCIIVSLKFFGVRSRRFGREIGFFSVVVRFLSSFEGWW